MAPWSAPTLAALFLLLLPAAPAAAQDAPPCPREVTAVATPDGRVTVTWTTPAMVAYDRIVVERLFPVTGWRVVATLDGDATMWSTEVSLETTHLFRVVGVTGEVRCTGPEEADLALVPDLPGGLAMVLAAVGGTGIVALMRRR